MWMTPFVSWRVNSRGNIEISEHYQPFNPVHSVARNRQPTTLPGCPTDDNNKKIKTTVYRKKTHTDRYLSFTSHHPVQVKRSTVTTLLKRARDVISDRHLLKKELEHLQGVMLNNEYPIGFLKRCRTLKWKEKNDDEEYKPLTTICRRIWWGDTEDPERLQHQNSHQH